MYYFFPYFPYYKIPRLITSYFKGNSTWSAPPFSHTYERCYASTLTAITASFFPFIDKNVVSKEQFFISYERNALIRHVVYKQFTSSVIHCALLCMNNPACKTINYKSVLEDEEGECELNSATAHDFPLHLIYSSHSTYSVPIG